MKDKVIDEIRGILRDSQSWVRLQIEYAKLTTAEKFTILTSAFVLGAICMLLGMIVVIFLCLALVDLFKDFLSAPLAYLSVAGILAVIILMIWIFRRPLLFNPIARYVTGLLLDSKKKE